MGVKLGASQAVEQLLFFVLDPLLEILLHLQWQLRPVLVAQGPEQEIHEIAKRALLLRLGRLA